jgi:hypothetical protein
MHAPCDALQWPENSQLLDALQSAVVSAMQSPVFSEQ